MGWQIGAYILGGLCAIWVIGFLLKLGGLFAIETYANYFIRK